MSRALPDRLAGIAAARSAADVRETIEREAAAAGFDAVGIARVDELGTAPGERLRQFIELGLHGDMDWMATTAERRSHPAGLWPQARTAVVLAMSYAPRTDPLAILAEPSRAAVSVYAQGKDYHDVVKPRLKRVAGALAKAADCDVKVFVDTAPLMEKPLAALAGIGWQGKHTNLVSRQHGSWLFLGVILATAQITGSAAAADRCGSCTRCLDICPTAAIPAPYRLDPRRCIAYLTIEHKGPIDRSLRPQLGNRVYGCDDCLAVCPWNKFAAAAREARFHARPQTDNPPLAELLGLDDAAFRSRFAGTPVKRTGRDRLVRNALIAAGNSGDRELEPLVRARLSDEAAIVRGAAVWAFARLAPPDDLDRIGAACLAVERDTNVRAEWLAEGIS